MDKQEIALAAPPISLVGLTIAGISLPDWAAILASVYTILLIGDWVWKKWNRARNKTRRADDT